MSELPKGWVGIKLGDVIELKYGKSLPAKQRSDSGFPVYGSNGVVGLHHEPLVLGGGLIVGRKGSFGEVHLSVQDFSPIDTTYYIDSFPTGTMKYWYYQLKNLPLTKLNRSTAIPGLNREDAYAQNILLPPDAEQKRIVAKLDEVLAQVDAIKARLDRIPAILKRFRQSVLAAAVSGKLTEEWRGNFSLPESVLERYIKFRDNVIAGVSSVTQKEKLIKTHQKDENFEFPLAIPNTWLLKNLNKIAFGFSYGSSFKSQTAGIVPVLRMGNIQNGKLDWNDLVYTSDSTEIEKYRLSKGDILFNRTNSPELVGKTAIYQSEKEAIYAGYLIKVQGSELLYSEFLNIALNSLHAKNYCLSVKTDGVSQSNINAQKLGDFPCPLPSIEEQKEIVRLVEHYFVFADTIEAQVKKAQTRVDNLTQSILAKAFRGELVAQDPNDEPAEKLLERIAQARTEAEALAKTVKKAGRKVKATS
ncbi:restriction endonuclease subunit S [Shewanella xiamenensis]|uniref:restriction endonuclease subunit S n=1 Tax=Shewanella xiamenensis TaxID=332186 RepID=UPI002E7BB333|nr:restriction endonuclease subunit S [Shewanella xiamenensis]